MKAQLSLTENISVKRANAAGAFLIDIASSSDELFCIGTQLRVPSETARSLYDWLGELYDERARAYVTRDDQHSDRIEIEGVPDRSVYIDYYNDKPRLVVYETDHEEPRHLIDLPTAEEAN